MTELTAPHSNDEPSKPGLGQQPQAEHPAAQVTDAAQHDEQSEEEEDATRKIRLIDR